jgi:predicted metal-dependent hydrolase
MIKTPKNCEHKIATIIARKSRWIKEAKKRMLNKKGVIHTLNHDIKIYFLGQSFPLKLYKAERHSLDFTSQEGFTYNYVGDFDKSIFMKILDSFYLQKAKELLPKKIEEHSATTQLFPTKISFRNTKSQWGSCSKVNALSISTKAMKLPWNLIDYIIIHELAHIKHKHHQKTFWELVAKYVPDMQQSRKELREYA